MTALDEGMRWALDAPVYVRHEQTVDTDGKRWHRRNGLVLITRDGYLLKAHDGYVRGAYFVRQTRDDSRALLFERAWKSQKLKYGKDQYIDDDKQQMVRNVHVSFVSPGQWHQLPEHGKVARQRTTRQALPPSFDYSATRYSSQALHVLRQAEYAV